MYEVLFGMPPQNVSLSPLRMSWLSRTNVARPLLSSRQRSTRPGPSGLNRSLKSPSTAGTAVPLSVSEHTRRFDIEIIADASVRKLRCTTIGDGRSRAQRNMAPLSASMPCAVLYACCLSCRPQLRTGSRGPVNRANKCSLLRIDSRTPWSRSWAQTEREKRRRDRDPCETQGTTSIKSLCGRKRFWRFHSCHRHQTDQYLNYPSLAPRTHRAPQRGHRGQRSARWRAPARMPCVWTMTFRLQTSRYLSFVHVCVCVYASAFVSL